MAVSTAPAARQKVLDLLAAAPGLEDVSVMRGAPVSDADIDTQMIYLGGVRRTLEPKVLGNQRLDEEYRFPVIAITRNWGHDEAGCEQRAWELVGEIETAIRADLTLANVLNEWVLFGEQTLNTEPLADGFLARVTVELVCRARI